MPLLPLISNKPLWKIINKITSCITGILCIYYRMPKDTKTYRQKQDQRDAEYKRATKKWIKSLGKSGTKRAARLGITGPHIDSQGSGAPEVDMSRESQPGSYEDDFEFDEPEPEMDTVDFVVRRARRGIRAVLVAIADSKNARLTTDCALLVTGVGYLGLSETTIAAKYNLSRAAISKRCVELCTALGLPPSRSMKSEDARKSYRKSSTQAHSEWK